MPTLITFKILNNKERLVSHFIDEQLKHREDKCCVACPGSHSKRGGGHTRILGSLGSIHNANCSASSNQRGHSKNKAYYVTPQPQTLQWLPIALGMKIKSSLSVSRPCLLHPPFVPHFPWLSAHCCTGPLCSQNISPSCSYHRAFVPTTSPTWSTLRHPPLIHPHLINFGSSKHLLQKAHPDCHPWSTPPLSPPRYINPMATFPLLICLCEYLTHICSSN